MKSAKSANWPVGLYFSVAVYLFVSVAAGWGLWGAFNDVRLQLRSDLYGLTVDVVRTHELAGRYLDELEVYLENQGGAVLPHITQRIAILKGRKKILMAPIERMTLEPEFKAAFTKTLGDYIVALENIEVLLASGTLAGEKLHQIEDQVFAVEDAVSLIYTSSQDYIQGNVGRQHQILKTLSVLLVGLVVTLLVLLGGLVLIMRTLRLTRGRAEKANSDKSTFLAAASHDMRQPLQAISLFLYALKSNETSHANLEIIGLLDKSAASLGHILDRVLDLSRLESGVIKIEKQTFSVHTMLNHLVDEFGPAAADKGLTLSVVPCSKNVYSDPHLLENVLRNLIANAIKYTDFGQVLIGCRHKGEDKVQIQVWDTGIGIAEDQQSRIYDEFYQLSVNPRNTEMGLGLGLSIVQRVAALLNHELEMSSKPGRGSMFSVTVPLDRSSVALKYDVANTDKREMCENLSIVVIDDEEAVRKSLSMVLANSNNRVVSAPYVDCSNDAAMLAFPREMPDIIIADYRLENDMTGVDAISSLCAYYEKDIPAILLTGDTAPHRLQEIAQSGYPLLHKPIDGDKLFLQIRDVLFQEPAAKG